ncbi:MAG TPA: adenylate/guanylate cyclase domain-containing protein [Thermomicrobiales bacterium]|nr:adenylate/guanylate cyclase domain-containing protein [Thermomicrobiales bacterium]
MSELPSGTVTFLFTDIEGSTQRWQQEPSAMAPALARHDRLVREAIESHGGAVFKTVGDAFCAAFADPAEALGAALTAQRSLYGEPWGATGPLRVRMALHTGRAEVQDGDYVGAPLNRVARLLSAGHGGQVLLSGATAELVHDHLPREVHLRDLGTHQLKDLYRPEHIFQVVTPDLPADFSPLVTAASLPPYPAAADAADQGFPAAAAPAPPARRHTALIAGGAVAAALLLLVGIFAFGLDDEPDPQATGVPAVAVVTATPTPYAEGTNYWGVIATPPPAPAFVVLGELIFDAGWSGTSQSLPGPMMLYVDERQPYPPRIWFGADVTLMRNVIPGTPAHEETLPAATFFDLGPNDQIVVPANTEFAVQTDQGHPGALFAMIVFPAGPLTTVPDALQWNWASWGSVQEWPPGPVEVLWDTYELAPGESRSVPMRDWPQIVLNEGSSDSGTGGVGIMLASGSGELPPVIGFDQQQLAHPGEAIRSALGTAGPGSGSGPLEANRTPIVPGTEAMLGGSLLAQSGSAFLEPGSSGTIRNPREASAPVVIIVLTFAPLSSSA